MDPEAVTNAVAASRSAEKRRQGHSGRAVSACLALAVACSGTLLLILQSDLTFLFDEWDFLLYRRGVSVGAFLDPHNEHIVLAPVAIYKALLITFGMDSALPFQVISTLVFLLSAVLLFAHLRGCVGEWLALLAACLVLFLGPAWLDLLWPFQIGYSGSIAAGLGMLLALRRDDRAGDRVACVLLAVSLAFSSIGLAFAAGALVDLALSRRHWAARLYVPLTPLLLFAAWWLGWGHTAESHLSFHNLLTSPKYVFDAASQATASLVGLATPSGDPSNPVGLNRGRVLLIVGLLLAAVRIWRLGTVQRALWIALAVGVAFWFLAALNQSVFRLATNGRYQYPGAIFVLLIAAEALRGVRPGRWALIAATPLAALAVASNIIYLQRGHERIFKPVSDNERAELAALEIARRTVDPSFALTLKRGGVFLAPIDAGSYLSAVDAYGSPAYTEPELASRPESQRVAADQILAAALSVRLSPLGRVVAPAGCRTVHASASGAPSLPVHAGRLTLGGNAERGVEVLLGRFSDELPIDLGTLRWRVGASLMIPPDRSARPWRLGLKGKGAVTVCGPAA